MDINKQMKIYLPNFFQLQHAFLYTERTLKVAEKKITNFISKLKYYLFQYISPFHEFNVAKYNFIYKKELDNLTKTCYH